MKVVITGGAGFLGRRLAEALVHKGALADGRGEATAIDRLVLVDAVSPERPLADVEYAIGDIAEPGLFERVVTEDVASIFHLAAVVSSAAEADFDLGMRVNVDATRALIEQCRRLPSPPRLVFTSSVAVFGLADPIITDATPLKPQSSYGAQKVIGELLISDCSRKGFIDGRCVRLPTIVVRPGRPNKAASSFASSILREPLAGEEADCPVAPELPIWILSPRQAIRSLIHAHELPPDAWGADRGLNLPGVSVTVGEMVDALRRAGGDADLIRWRRDPAIERIVTTWPAGMQTTRADALGFQADADIDAIIAAYLEDDFQPATSTLGTEVGA